VDDRLNRHNLTDEEWARLVPLLPAHPRQGHRRHIKAVIPDVATIRIWLRDPVP
jgi:transposase